MHYFTDSGNSSKQTKRDDQMGSNILRSEGYQHNCLEFMGLSPVMPGCLWWGAAFTDQGCFYLVSSTPNPMQVIIWDLETTRTVF